MADVKLASVKALKLTQEYPSKIFLKHSFTETNYKEVVLIKNLKNLSKKAKLQAVYTGNKELNPKTKEGLVSLVNLRRIPAIYADFYNNL